MISAISFQVFDAASPHDWPEGLVRDSYPWHSRLVGTRSWAPQQSGVWSRPAAPSFVPVFVSSGFGSKGSRRATRAAPVRSARVAPALRGAPGPNAGKLQQTCGEPWAVCTPTGDVTDNVLEGRWPGRSVVPHPLRQLGLPVVVRHQRLAKRPSAAEGPGVEAGRRSRPPG